ncbi:hypothetical protein THTE_4474 [Thermogutta terrifontis]|uniref:Uncharacterized protein n=1 Tax=Thermogutta terrifontis TaxID=1331910 RepID=A0A286RM68_9BACT|nr:hypothetical protein THTE_4474 [Thermogutta terrifontis]
MEGLNEPNHIFALPPIHPHSLDNRKVILHKIWPRLSTI